MKAEIITIGDEILLGQTIDTNSAFISRELNQLGIDVNYKTSVGDDIQTISEALTTGLSRADLVITTGGLGPTNDDFEEGGGRLQKKGNGDAQDQSEPGTSTPGV